MAFSILILLYLLQSLSFASSQSFIGVNYGQVADNLPPPSATAKLLQSTAVQKVRLYGADPAIIKALANTGIGILTPSSKIILITVGNEVLLSNDQNLISQLLPAMQNMQKALNSASLGGKVKVSTVHSMAILSQSDPPSAGLFNPANQDIMRGLLQFQKDNGSPISVNPYPFFAYQSDRRPETLAFCLFQPNSGRVDSGNGIKYIDMGNLRGIRLAHDGKVDAVRSALNAMGFNDIEMKPGPTSERSFGLFKPDLSMTYDIGLSKSSLTPTPSTPKTPVTPSTKPTTAGWCVAKTGASDAQLQAGLDYACGQGIDCGPIQPGGACFEPNTLASHAAYAMNIYYQASAKNPWDCDFSETATLTSKNPSYNGCAYPGGST
ncbi:hypothetical protein OIU78_008607 [Salix suchowensis]|nr:hypothetical protein OIU78_008607 [Salix suchowensis]